MMQDHMAPHGSCREPEQTSQTGCVESSRFHNENGASDCWSGETFTPVTGLIITSHQAQRFFCFLFQG